MKAASLSLPRFLIHWSIVIALVLSAFGAGSLMSASGIDVIEVVSAQEAKCDGWASNGSSHRNAGNGCTYTCKNGSWSGPSKCDGSGNGQFQGEAAKSEEERKKQEEAVRERQQEAEKKEQEQGAAETARIAAETAEQRAKEAARQQAMVESQRQAAVAEAQAKNDKAALEAANQRAQQASQQVSQAQGTNRGSEIVGTGDLRARDIAAVGYDPNSALALGTANLSQVPQSSQVALANAAVNVANLNGACDVNTGSPNSVAAGAACCRGGVVECGGGTNGSCMSDIDRPGVVGYCGAAGQPDVSGFCGDNFCQATETVQNCTKDCAVTSSIGYRLYSLQNGECVPCVPGATGGCVSLAACSPQQIAPLSSAALVQVEGLTSLHQRCYFDIDMAEGTLDPGCVSQITRTQQGLQEQPEGQRILAEVQVRVQAERRIYTLAGTIANQQVNCLGGCNEEIAANQQSLQQALTNLQNLNPTRADNVRENSEKYQQSIRNASLERVRLVEQHKEQIEAMARACDPNDSGCAQRVQEQVEIRIGQYSANSAFCLKYPNVPTCEQSVQDVQRQMNEILIAEVYTQARYTILNGQCQACRADQSCQYASLSDCRSSLVIAQNQQIQQCSDGTRVGACNNSGQRCNANGQLIASTACTVSTSEEIVEPRETCPSGSSSSQFICGFFGAQCEQGSDGCRREAAVTPQVTLPQQSTEEREEVSSCLPGTFETQSACQTLGNSCSQGSDGCWVTGSVTEQVPQISSRCSPVNTWITVELFCNDQGKVVRAPSNELLNSAEEVPVTAPTLANRLQSTVCQLQGKVYEANGECLPKPVQIDGYQEYLPRGQRINAIECDNFGYRFESGRCYAPVREPDQPILDVSRRGFSEQEMAPSILPDEDVTELLWQLDLYLDDADRKVDQATPQSYSNTRTDIDRFYTSLEEIYEQRCTPAIAQLQECQDLANELASAKARASELDREVARRGVQNILFNLQPSEEELERALRSGYVNEASCKRAGWSECTILSGADITIPSVDATYLGSNVFMRVARQAVAAIQPEHRVVVSRDGLVFATEVNLARCHQVVPTNGSHVLLDGKCYEKAPGANLYPDRCSYESEATYHMLQTVDGCFTLPNTESSEVLVDNARTENACASFSRLECSLSNACTELQGSCVARVVESRDSGTCEPFSGHTPSGEAAYIRLTNGSMTTYSGSCTQCVCPSEGNCRKASCDAAVVSNVQMVNGEPQIEEMISALRQTEQNLPVTFVVPTSGISREHWNPMVTALELLPSSVFQLIPAVAEGGKLNYYLDSPGNEGGHTDGRGYLMIGAPGCSERGTYTQNTNVECGYPQSILIHETLHNTDSAQISDSNLCEGEACTLLEAFERVSAQDGVHFTNDQTPSSRVDRGEDFLLYGQYPTSVVEGYAISGAAYVLAPDSLQQNQPQVYEFYKEHVFGGEEYIEIANSDCQSSRIAVQTNTTRAEALQRAQECSQL